MSLRFPKVFEYIGEDKNAEWRVSSKYLTGMDLNFVLEDMTVPDSPLAVVEDIFFIDEGGERMTRKITGQGFLGLGSKERPASTCLSIHGNETLHFKELTKEFRKTTNKFERLLQLLLIDPPPGFDKESLLQLLRKQVDGKSR